MNITKFNVKELSAVINGEIRSRRAPSDVTGFSIDSRTVKPGDLFIAIKGDAFNGHDFVHEAESRGASAVVIDDPRAVKDIASLHNVIRVESTFESLKNLSRKLRNMTGARVVAVTGTNGKTTVKEILKKVLSAKYRVLASRKSYNNLIGLTLTLFELSQDDEIAVLELGTNHPGEISELAAIARPDIGIVTNVGYGHIEAFKDLGGVFREKTSIFDHVRSGGIAMTNRDDEMLSRFCPAACGLKTYGRSAGSDFFVSGVYPRADKGYDFILNGEKYSIPVYGIHNVSNAAAAIGAALILGMNPEEIKNSLKDMCLPEMRLAEVRRGDVLFLNDAYNANPSSFASAIETLKNDARFANKGIVAGDMLELGESSDVLHLQVGREIAGKK